jgi:hypothetical protein
MNPLCADPADERLIDDRVVVVRPIEWFPAFGAVLVALFAEEQGHTA